MGEQPTAASESAVRIEGERAAGSPLGSGVEKQTQLQEAAAVVNTLAALRGPGGPAAANNLYEAYCASAVGLLKYKQALAAEAGPAGGHGGELRREAEQLLRGALVTQRRLHGDAHPYSKKTERRLADVVGPSG